MTELHQDFFAPASTDYIDTMVAEYRQIRGDCERLAGLISSNDMMNRAVSFFIEGNKDERDNFLSTSVKRLFRLEGAIARLNSHYWTMALSKTDLFEVMPAKRRDEWHTQLRHPEGKEKYGSWGKEWEIAPLPDFEESTVRATIEDLLASRHRYFAERVDGIFKGLSGDHVTNQPQGFYKRMIFARVFDQRWGSTDYNKRNIIHDLRVVIARLEGREEPASGSTENILVHARRNHGQYVMVDGNRLKIKAFMVGTCHIEIHPEVATMLNIVLSSIYPKAIPPKFRQRNPQAVKTWEVIQRPLPAAVLKFLVDARPAVEKYKDGWRDCFRGISDSINIAGLPTAIKDDVEYILSSIGGVKIEQYFKFSFDPMPVLAEIVSNGAIPDKKSHQFYPTPKTLAEKVIEIADIQQGMAVLEPSAGVGGLADLVPDRDSVLCVELSALHAKVLREKGYNTICGDFLGMNPEDALTYSRIVMNPPFADGRWQAHLEHAGKFLANDGVLTAILPSGAKNKDPLPHMDCEWFGAFDNMFPDASVSVVILRAKFK